MIPFFDTSVLIAAFIEGERRHEKCSKAIASNAGGFVYTHALSECFSILTGGRVSIQFHTTRHFFGERKEPQITQPKHSEDSRRILLEGKWAQIKRC